MSRARSAKDLLQANHDRCLSIQTVCLDALSGLAAYGRRTVSPLPSFFSGPSTPGMAPHVTEESEDGGHFYISRAPAGLRAKLVQGNIDCKSGSRYRQEMTQFQHVWILACFRRDLWCSGVRILADNFNDNNERCGFTTRKAADWLPWKKPIHSHERSSYTTMKESSIQPLKRLMHNTERG